MTYPHLLRMANLATCAILLCACAAPDRAAVIDSPSNSAMYALELTPATRTVNVALGDHVTFVSGGRSFVYSFDDPNYWPVQLDRVLPPGMVDHQVTAYVSPYRKFFGRDSRSRN
ncbi:Heavy-metal resistance protein CzcE [Noviherbaspirillum humi]|uniref:Heavy-metal resistance protein CzcE n=1 Tax=Noviherbaspirillum humi TaxID=1688639 RepID=A0A239F4D4_9BURK|nr:CzcE family metal-binding protein [Noviherbaspirillum humi]SNS51368.1 Heavy-metal resistance protein CzcE [Noviherbaspirillum humi]